MPERREDPQAKWYYEARFPGMDMRMDENAVDPRMLVDAVGVDGRFEGSVRTFPGFGAQSVHGVPSPEVGVTTIESIDNISLVKYVSLRKGTTPHSIRGLMMFGDNQAGTGKALYFAYRDSDTGVSDVIMLEDFRDWDDFRPDTFEDFDITYLGRYAYFVNSGDIVTTLPSFSDKAVPYNKAYFWDFKVNDWDKYVGDFQGRFMGTLPERILATDVNDVGGGGLDPSDDVMDVTGAGLTSNMASGEYTVAVELISRKHNLRSLLRLGTFRLGESGTTNLRATISRVRLPDSGGGSTNQIQGNSQTLTAAIHWGIGHVDGFRLWRSPRNDLGSVTVSSQYQTTQHLYLLANYIEKDFYDSATGAQSWRLSLSNDAFGAAPFDFSVPVISDDGLLTQLQYDAVANEVGAAPRMKRLVGFDGMLVGVTDPREPTTPDQDWKNVERLPEALCWSAISQGETENFPVLNYEELDDPSERVLGLFAGSTAAFAVTNMGIYRILRAGTSLSVSRIAYPLGCVGRFAACVVGDVLYVVTRTGVKEIDGATGEVRNVRLLNRLVFDDKRWANTLSSVQVGYDGFAGAILFLNTSLHELVLLWESTGAVTRIVDAPWSFIASGPDVKTNNGAQRAYLVDSAGKSHTVDAFREAGKATMCGAGASETVNGTVTSISSTNIIDSTATFPVGCVGFKCYILSGVRDGESVDITVRNSATNLSVSGLSGALAVGDRYSIAPVVVTLRFARLAGLGADDPFVRKIASSITASLSDLQGETSSNDVNAYVYMGLHSGSAELVSEPVRVNAVPDQVAVRANVAKTKLFPFIASYGSNMDFEVDALLVQGQLTPSEAETRQG
jgi:hypothetical protein